MTYKFVDIYDLKSGDKFANKDGDIYTARNTSYTSDGDTFVIDEETECMWFSNKIDWETTRLMYNKTKQTPELIKDRLNQIEELKNKANEIYRSLNTKFGLTYSKEHHIGDIIDDRYIVTKCEECECGGHWETMWAEIEK